MASLVLLCFCVRPIQSEREGRLHTEHTELRPALRKRGGIFSSFAEPFFYAAALWGSHAHARCGDLATLQDAPARCAKGSGISTSASFTMHVGAYSFSSPTRHVRAAARALCFCTTAFAASYGEVQLLGLEALFNSTNGQGWITSTGWRDSLVDICNWYGVVCDSESGNVTGLSLSSNGLVGDVSEATALSNVSSLKELDLADNQLSGPVPLIFGLMPQLEKIDLSQNELSSFPASWGSGASSLRYMSLQNNMISG